MLAECAPAERAVFPQPELPVAVPPVPPVPPDPAPPGLVPPELRPPELVPPLVAVSPPVPPLTELVPASPELPAAPWWSEPLEQPSANRAMTAAWFPVASLRESMRRYAPDTGA